jgi:hypothetical protein
MSLELITKNEIEGSGYKLSGQIGDADRYRQGNSFLYVKPVDDKYKIEAWYYMTDTKFNRYNATGIQRRLFE